MKPMIPGRLHAQGLVAPRFETAAEVVRHLTCVQSQLHDMALWAVARRTHGQTLADLQAAFDRGDVLRTHVLRPTWHLVDPADIHWLLALTAPRIARLMASTNRTIGLDESLLDRCTEVVLQSLAAGEPRTRSELAADLEEAGLRHTGQSLAHVVMHAEINALVVNGPMRGRQHTYVPLPARPPSHPSRDELLAEVARRYAVGHGPFRDKDLAWWTSLTLTDSRRGIESAGLRPLDVDGETYWHVDDPVDADVPPVMLMSNFDEYISFARDAEDFSAYAASVNDIARVSGLLMLDGRFAGTWTRAMTATTVRIVVDTSARVTASTRRAVHGEAEAFGRFVDREPVVTYAA